MLFTRVRFQVSVISRPNGSAVKISRPTTSPAECKKRNCSRSVRAVLTRSHARWPQFTNMSFVCGTFTVRLAHSLPSRSPSRPILHRPASLRPILCRSSEARESWSRCPPSWPPSRPVPSRPPSPRPRIPHHSALRYKSHSCFSSFNSAARLFCFSVT